jgi:pyrimidine operon attenuation protein/uracil phosphoribosyltransferase
VTRTFDDDFVARSFDHLLSAVSSAFSPDSPLNVVGLRTRGATLSDRLVARLRARGYIAIDHGIIDITMYRDDMRSLGASRPVRVTRLDLDLDAKPLLLVDDVIFSGRSIRAAMDLLSDFGRPSVIRLAVLIDRGGRELPIQPDFLGARIDDADPGHRVSLRLHEIDGIDQVIIAPKPG